MIKNKSSDGDFAKKKIQPSVGSKHIYFFPGQKMQIHKEKRNYNRKKAIFNATFRPLHKIFFSLFKLSTIKTVQYHIVKI